MPRFIKELDADDDGQLSKDELAKLSDKFSDLDENEDGQLDMQELMGPPPEGFAGGPFNRGRGFGPPEGRGPQGGPPGPGGRPGFGPPDGAGGLRRGPEGPEGARRGPNPEAMLKRFDKNNDGKLSEDEVNENLKKRFAKIDTNADGAIDLAELEAMLDKRAQKQPGPKPPQGDQPPKEKAE